MNEYLWILQLVAPAAALAGVGIGVLSTRSLALQAARIQWNSAQIEATRKFQADTIAAAHELSILYHRLCQDTQAFIQEARGRIQAGETLTSEEMYFRYSAEQQNRIKDGTDAWRKVLAQRIVHADERMSQAMENLDRIREDATLALNAANLPAAVAAANEFQTNLKNLYKAIKRSSLESNLILNEHFTPGLRRGRLRKLILKDIERIDGTETGTLKR